MSARRSRVSSPMSSRSIGTMSDLDPVDSDAKWGLMVTGGSWSVWMTFPIFSRAGAAGRIALVEEGARLLGVPATDCIARSGAVVAGERSISYAEIVRRGNLSRTFTADELAQTPIKPASERRLIGRTVHALDVPSKTTGAARLRHRRESRGNGLCPAKNPADTQRLQGARNRRFRRARCEGLYQQHGPRRSVGHGARLGHGLRRHPIRPPIRAADRVKVDWTVGEGGERLRAGYSGIRRNADCRSAGRRLAGRRRGCRCCFSCGKVHAHAVLYDRQRPPCSARAGQCARLREGRDLRDSHRQSVADADPAGAFQGARTAAGAHRAA